MGRVVYEPAPDVCRVVDALLDAGLFPHVRRDRVFCVRSRGARTTAVARIYGLPRPWVAVGLEPGYVIEVVSERYYRLPCMERARVILHELLHIPYSFSGGLRGHGPVFRRLWRSLSRRVPEEAVRRACLE